MKIIKNGSVALGSDAEEIPTTHSSQTRLWLMLARHATATL